ncbi:carboxypeptidase-like regulatory domain-containing protein [Ferruginibacter sp. SUN106]|uniref:carboxypeptidase-like regulatory domain-containing protein n=1 Tax=Ferruginibacter sp. SUN106 TaxID=2978348 RepID=UPI003D36302F
MRSNLLFLILYLLPASVFSQQTDYYITGKIIDAVTKAPLPGASVFAQNTTIGTAADAEGNFKLSLPAGGYDLIITCIGYQPEIRRISASENNSKNIVVELMQKDKSLKDVVISNELADGWEKYGAFFLENFIGKTFNSNSCSIANKQVLKFYFSTKKNTLKVLADTPLIIVNKALGYKIKYTLVSFSYDYDKLITLYKGYPLYEELQPEDTLEKINWEAARLKAYNGSMIHFMRSLYQKQVKENGFEIKYLKKRFSEKETLVPILNYYQALGYEIDDSTQDVLVLPEENELVVIYNKDVPEQTYVKADPTASVKYQLSVLTFKPAQVIGVEVNGYYFEQTGITKSGYMAWMRMANTLPYDFKIK